MMQRRGSSPFVEDRRRRKKTSVLDLIGFYLGSILYLLLAS